MTGLNYHSLPSPDYTGDSDSESEVAKELAQKRREIDEEIARFKSLKDKEFREFEHDLKCRRRQRRASQQGKSTNGINYYEFIKNSPSNTPPSNPVLSACEKKYRSPSGQLQPIRLIKANASPKVTPPTICLDKINVSKEHSSHAHASPLQTPPTPTKSSTSTTCEASHPRHDSSPNTNSAPIRSNQPRDKVPFLPESTPHDDQGALGGIFVPGYLPLLDSRHDRAQRQVEGISTEPASPAEPNMMPIVAVHSSSLPTESSLSESFQVPQTKRAYTSPTASLNRTKLPPIIRNVNGRKHKSGKRKHVTFQLADRAIVEPSSSYEEGPSPDVEGAGDTRRSTASHHTLNPEPDTDDDSSRPRFQRKSTPLDPFGRWRPTLKPLETPEEEVGMSMGDLLLGDRDDDDDDLVGSVGEVDTDYFSLRRSDDSPVRQASNEQSWTPMNSPPKQRHSSLDLYSLSFGTSNQKTSPKLRQSPRFSPRHSPGMKPSRYPGMLEDDSLRGNANVGFFELDEELSVGEDPMSNLDESDIMEDDLELGLKHQGLKEQKIEEIKTGSSLPISIVRPGTGSVSNSWVGTFGH